MITNKPTPFAQLLALGRRMAGAKQGNVAVISAFMMIPMLFALGMGVDYTLAARRQDQINGYADAAALVGVTPNMMAQNSTAAQTAASNMFSAQLSTIGQVTYSNTNISVTATDTSSGAALTRTVKVSYSANSSNMFSGILGLSSIPIGGSSTATSSLSPKIDFYMLLDTSPSMEIASSTAGIATMVANTSSQGGCAFGCHETNPSADNLGNSKSVVCTDGKKDFYPNGGEDNYALARCLGVTLRIDLVNQAVQSLMTTAQTTAAENHTSYRAAIYTMDYAVNSLQALTSNLSTAATSAANLAAVTVYDNSCLTKTNCNNDEDSYLDAGINNLNTIMPNPGTGTSNPGDTPQELLFIVTDGVTDYSNGGRVMSPINTNYSYCTTVKNRGIRIAMLYLTYNPLPTNSFYNSNIAPFQSQIATDAQNCASSGLFFEVNTGGDITAAMTTLFEKAVATAHLSQ